jgi:hypothetical protein
MASLTTTTSVDFRTCINFSNVAKELEKINQNLEQAKRENDTENLRTITSTAVQALNALESRTDGFKQLYATTQVAKAYTKLYYNVDIELRSRVSLISFTPAPSRFRQASSASSSASATTSNAGSQITYDDYEGLREGHEDTLRAGMDESNEDADLQKAIRESILDRARGYSHDTSSSRQDLSSNSQRVLPLFSSAPTLTSSSSSAAKNDRDLALAIKASLATMNQRPQQVRAQTQAQRTSRCHQVATTTLAVGSRLGWSNCAAAVVTVATTAIGGWVLGGAILGIYLLGRVSAKVKL